MCFKTVSVVHSSLLFSSTSLSLCPHIRQHGERRLVRTACARLSRHRHFVVPTVRIYSHCLVMGAWVGGGVRGRGVIDLTIVLILMSSVDYLNSFTTDYSPQTYGTSYFLSNDVFQVKIKKQSINIFEKHNIFTYLLH